MKSQAGRRVLVLFDGQNLFKSAREVFGITRWAYDPKKLAERMADRVGATLGGIVFYTGIPKWDKHRDLREFWERKFEDYRGDGITVEFRELKYKGADDVRGREKGIDVLIALDMYDAVVTGEITDIVLFSQDSDLHEAVCRARRFLEREQRTTGKARAVSFHCAFPFDAERARELSEWRPGDGTKRPAVNPRGIDKTNWIRLAVEDFEACNDEREIAIKQAKVNLPAEYAKLETQYRKRVYDGYNVAEQGRGYVTGRVVGVYRLPARGVVVFETTTDLLAVGLPHGCLASFEAVHGKLVNAKQQGEALALLPIGPEEARQPGTSKTK